jgi:ABC-2 type transport system permease protein
MTGILAALRVETLKVLRSKVLLFTFLGFCLAPLAGGYFMWILKDPELARRMGLIGLKAEITAGTAEWSSQFSLLAQAMAFGGLVGFGFIASWLFGREYANRTMKDLLALPTPRSAFVTAKFIVMAVWGCALAGVVIGLGIAAGSMVGLPGWSAATVTQGVLLIVELAALDLALTTVVAFVACVTRGYLPPLAWMFVTIVFAILVSAVGWGMYFPWSVPALRSGAAGADLALLPPVSYWLVVITGLAGLAATYAWWQFADQPV